MTFRLKQTNRKNGSQFIRSTDQRTHTHTHGLLNSLEIKIFRFFNFFFSDQPVTSRKTKTKILCIKSIETEKQKKNGCQGQANDACMQCACIPITSCQWQPIYSLCEQMKQNNFVDCRLIANNENDNDEIFVLNLCHSNQSSVSHTHTHKHESKAIYFK